MKSPTTAIIWELWRTTRSEAVAKTLGIAACIMLLFLVTRLKGGNPGEAELRVINGVVILLLVISCSSISTCWLPLDNSGQGFIFRLGFMRPVTTAKLVTLPIAYTVCLGIVSFLVPALLWNLLQGFAIPLLGPSLLIAMVIITTTAATWCPQTRAVKILMLGSCLAAIFGFVFLRDFLLNDSEPILMAIGGREYYRFGWQEWTLLLGSSFGAVLLTVKAVDRQRHGEGLLTQRIAIHSKRSRGPAKNRQLKPFRNSITAQFAYELRRFGRTIMLLALFIAAASMLFAIAGNCLFRNSSGGPTILLGTLFASPLIFQIVGAEGALAIRHKHGASQFPVFDATRPLTNEQLIIIKIATISCCTLAGWAIVALPTGIYAGLGFDSLAWQQISSVVMDYAGETNSWGWFGIATTCGLFYLSNSCVLLAAGMWLTNHGKLLLAISSALYASIMLAVWDFHNQAWSLRFLWEALGYGYAIAVVVFVARILVLANSYGNLLRPLFLGALLLWLCYVGLVVRYGSQLIPDTTPVPLLAALWASLLIPLAATAATPLALAEQRHR